MQVADGSAKRSGVEVADGPAGRRGALLALTSALALSVSSICAGPALAQTAGSGTAPGSAAGSTLPEVTVEPPKAKAKPKAVAAEPAKAPSNTTVKKPKVAAKKKPAPAPQPAPAAEPEFVEAPSAPTASSEATGIGPLSQGADITIGQTSLARRQPSTVQGVFADQSSIAVGGTTQSSTKVYVHGIEEGMLNVQIDGARQAQRSAFHHNGNNLIDPSILKGVAIDAGASPADAGPHALGGSIRYTTKDATDLLRPGQTMGGFGKLTYDTSAHTFAKSGAAYAAMGGFEVLGYALQADGDAYEDGRGNTVVATDVDLLNFLGKIAYEAPSGDRVAFSGEYVNDQGIRPFRANLAVSAVPGNPAAYSFNEAERQTYTFKYNTTKPGGLYDPEVSLYYNKTSLDRPPLAGCTAGPCVAFGLVEIESFGGKAQNTFALGYGALTLGFDFYRDDVTTTRSGVGAAFNGTFGETLSNVGAYAQYRLALAEPFRISAGVRVDRNELEAKDGQTFENTGVSPNISAELDLTRWLTAKASYGYSFGGIPTYEAILFRVANPVYSPALDPQYGQTYKLGMQARLGGLLAEASYFNTRLIDPVCANCTVPTLVGNLDDVETKGVDISIKYAWRNAQLAANFTHTESSFGSGPLTTTSYYYGTPFGDILKLSGHYEFEGTGVSVGFLSQIAFEYDELATVPFPQGGFYGKLDAYDVHNIYAQWVPNFAPNVTLRVDALNLFDAYYFDRATAVGGTLVPLASQGRTVLLSGKVEF